MSPPHDPAYYLRDAYQFAWDYSDDPDTKNGSVLITADGEFVWGANRFPRGVQVLPERLQRPDKYDFMVHAEQDVILRAAACGLSTAGSILYCPWAPCCDCAKAIITSGVAEVHTHKQMHDKTPERWQANIDRALQMLAEAGVSYTRHDLKLGGVYGLFNGEEWTP